MLLNISIVEYCRIHNIVNCGDCQKTKLMDHQTNRAQILSQGKNDQNQIILPRTHYIKTKKKERDDQVRMIEGLCDNNNVENQIRDTVMKNNYLRLLRVENNLMAIQGIH